MDITTLSIADLYAAKSQAKEKESFYRSVKSIKPEYDDAHNLWADMLHRIDAELSSQLLAIKYN